MAPPSYSTQYYISSYPYPLFSMFVRPSAHLIRLTDAFSRGGGQTGRRDDGCTAPQLRSAPRSRRGRGSRAGAFSPVDQSDCVSGVTHKLLRPHPSSTPPFRRLIAQDERPTGKNLLLRLLLGLPWRSMDGTELFHLDAVNRYLNPHTST